MLGGAVAPNPPAQPSGLDLAHVEAKKLLEAVRRHRVEIEAKQLLKNICSNCGRN